MQYIGGDIVEFDGRLAGRMAGGFDIPPEYAATHPRTQGFQSGFFNGEPSCQMSFRIAARKTVFQFAGGEHPLQKPLTVPIDGPVYPRYLDYVYARTDYHTFAPV